MHTWKRWLTFLNSLLITWTSPQDTWMRWESCSIRKPITWETFLGFAQEMPPHLANWRSIFTLGSKLKGLGGISFPREIVNTPNVHSFGRIYPNLEYIRACFIKNSFYNVKENYSKIKNNLLSYTTLENQVFLFFSFQLVLKWIFLHVQMIAQNWFYIQLSLHQALVFLSILIEEERCFRGHIKDEKAGEEACPELEHIQYLATSKYKEKKDQPHLMVYFLVFKPQI